MILVFYENRKDGGDNSETIINFDSSLSLSFFFFFIRQARLEAIRECKDLIKLLLSRVLKKS